MMIPKPKRIKSQKTINEVRKKFCEVCGRPGGEVHHIISKGAGGGDIKENLISLCRFCHNAAHWGQIDKEILWEFVAMRERKTVEQVRRAVAASMGREYV